MLRDPGNRRLAALAAIALAAVVALVMLLVSSSTSTGPARPALAARSAPLTSIFEADSQLRTDPATTLDTLKRLGVGVVKVYIPWEGVVPAATSKAAPAGFDASNPSAYPNATWAVYDAIVRDAQARGIGVDLTVGSPAPRWAASPGAPPHVNPQVWKPSAQQFGLFVSAVGERYSGRYVPPGASSPLPHVGLWSIWNEPNYGVDLAPQAIDAWRVEASPALYRGLLDAAWSALRATGHGGDQVLIGELAPRGVQAANGMVPLRFLRALYCVGSSFVALHGNAATARGCPPTAAGSEAFRSDHPALFDAAGVALHPYPEGATPPSQVTPDEPDYADFAARGKVESTLDRLQSAYGSSRKLPIYSTEFGYKTNPPYGGGAPVATAARYLNWAEYLSWRDPRVRSYDQYQLSDPPGASGSEFATGIEFASGMPKPEIYDAYRMPLYLPVTSFHPGQGVEVWGCARPAPEVELQTRDAQHVDIQVQSPERGTFRTIGPPVALTGSSCYFDVARRFRAGSAVRLRWTYPGGPAIFSRTVRITVH